VWLAALATALQTAANTGHTILLMADRNMFQERTRKGAL